MPAQGQRPGNQNNENISSEWARHADHGVIGPILKMIPNAGPARRLQNPARPL